MRVHVLGICGTFMAGLALLARQLGHEVTGSDAKAYPPMSDQLAAAGIGVVSGYENDRLAPVPDLVVVGNALARGNPAVERLLDAGIAYTSGPQWLAEHVLAGRHVLAVAGTHGKTTTTGLLAWILERAGRGPGFLVGGVPENFGVSARLGETGAPFVVEADEYDTAFFDKRSKFVHYRPLTLVVGNLEYDHADIFDDLEDIVRQFHHLVRTVPGRGRIVRPAADANVDRMLAMGCWTPVETFAVDEADWQAREVAPDGSRFTVVHAGAPVGKVRWELAGDHNVANALAAIAAAARAGVDPGDACEATGRYRNVKRRLEVRGRVDGITVYDDFAHHPTAIRATLEALRRRVGTARILAVLDPASNTMRLGVHRDTLGPSLQGADAIWVFRPADARWDLDVINDGVGRPARILDGVDGIVAEVSEAACSGDHVLVMSNANFGGIHVRLLDALARAHA